jgi:hypothetical protein
MSEMGRCRDCRWWDFRAESATVDPDEPQHQPTLDGACRRFGLPIKDNPGGVLNWTYEIEGWDTAKAYLNGTDVNTVCFMTEADFGCVQFEVKA